MSTMSEQSRKRAKEKVSRLTTSKTGVVDASGWKEETDQKGGVQTGMRPLSRRAFKKGGKVQGKKAEMRADRKPRAKGGGIVDDYFNVDQKKANELRDGEKHTGGLKSGGRAKKAGGGPSGWDKLSGKAPSDNVAKMSQLKDEKASFSPRYNQTAVQKEIDKDPRIGRGEAARIHRLLKGNYAAGGRTGKMMGGPMVGNRPMQRPVMPAGQSSAAPMGIRPQVGVRPMMRKAGGKVHEDKAEDKKLIKEELHKAGCSCAKCGGGKVGRASGGRTKYFKYGELMNRSPAEHDVINSKIAALEDAGFESHDAADHVLYGPDMRDQWRGTPMHPEDAAKEKVLKAHARTLKGTSGDKVEKKAGGALSDGMRPTGGRIERKAGGRAKKGGMNVNIIIAQPQQKPPMPPMGMPPGMPPGGPVGLHQGAPPPQAAAPAPMQPSPQVMPPQMRKAGGRTYPLKSGSGGGLGRLEKITAYG